jgi:hypothetical protein
MTDAHGRTTFTVDGSELCYSVALCEPVDFSLFAVLASVVDVRLHLLHCDSHSKYPCSFVYPTSDPPPSSGLCPPPFRRRIFGQFDMQVLIEDGTGHFHPPNNTSVDVWTDLTGTNVRLHQKETDARGRISFPSLPRGPYIWNVASIKWKILSPDWDEVFVAGPPCPPPIRFIYLAPAH